MGFRLFQAYFLVACTGICSLLYAQVPEGPRGIDVSQYQGRVDFPKVKNAGYSFVYIKATQGDTWRSPDYQQDLQQARAAGLVVGFYHYYMTDDSAENQFANFEQHVQFKPGDLPPVVDIEALAANSLSDLKTSLQTFLNLLEKRYGVKPIIYSGEYFASQHLQGFSAYPLWLAEYSVKKPELPGDWGHLTFWQSSQSGTVAGIDGPVDVDSFNGSQAEFRNLLLKTIPSQKP